MSITADLLSSPANVFAADRRRAERHRLPEIVPACIGRGAGTLVDLSATGVRVRHILPVPVGAHVRIRYDWRGSRFEGAAEVLASRFVSGGGGAATRYESRFRFLVLSEDAQRALERTLNHLEESNLRKWVANLRGWHEESGGGATETWLATSFILSRCVGGRWEQKITRTPYAPADGFTVPAGTDPRELLVLRRTYMISDDGRDMVRLVTRAVVKEHAPDSVDGIP